MAGVILNDTTIGNEDGGKFPATTNTAAVYMHVEWRTWINSFHIYSQAIELEKKSDSIQTATMLHCLGPLVQRIYETLPDKKDTFKEAEKALEQYFAPKRNVVAERYKFRSRKQNSDEPIDAYLSSLRELAKACEFGEFEDEMMRDQIVEKLSVDQFERTFISTL